MSSLDEDKLKECKIVFDMFDSDKDTKITTNELGDCLRVCGAAPSQQELEMIIQGIEENENKYISFEKFLSIFENLLQNQDTEEDIINELKKLDKNGSGTITVNDLKNLLANYGDVLTKEEVDDVIQEANADKGGNIIIEKFAKILLGKI
jgi:Ca2+-binding EF-hand superfamily protein